MNIEKYEAPSQASTETLIKGNQLKALSDKL